MSNNNKFEITFERAPKLRALRTTCDSSFASGSIVFKSAPYQALLVDEKVFVRDHHSFLEDSEKQLQRCSATKYARYYSRENQLKDWEEGYDLETKALKSSRMKVPVGTVRLAAKIIWRFQKERKQEDAKDWYSDDLKTKEVGLGVGYETVFDSLYHGEENRTFGLSNESDFTFAAMTRAYVTHSLNVDETIVSDEERAERYEREYEDIPSVSDIAKLIGKIRLNSHTLCDDELKPYGIGIYPFAAMMNHSENPNCFITFRGKELIVRSLRDIGPGEELCITYDELLKPRRERARLLKASYGFDVEDVEFDDSLNADPDPIKEIPLIGGHKLRSFPSAPKYTISADQKHWYEISRSNIKNDDVVDGGCHIFRLSSELNSNGEYNAFASFNLEESFDDDEENNDADDDAEENDDADEDDDMGLSNDPEFAAQKTYGQKNKTSLNNNNNNKKKKKTRLIVETWGNCNNVVTAEIAERFCQAFELVEKFASSEENVASLTRAWDRFNSLTDNSSSLFGASVGIAKGNHLRIKALEKFMNSAVVFENWSLALELANALTPWYREHYPHSYRHPQFALHATTVIKLKLEILMNDRNKFDSSAFVEKLEKIKEDAKAIAAEVSKVVGEDSQIVEALVKAMATSERMMAEDNMNIEQLEEEEEEGGGGGSFVLSRI